MQNGELTLDQVRPAYATIDAFHHKAAPGLDLPGFANLLAIAQSARQLQEEQDLYDLNVSSYLKLQRCSEQLGYLKSCWDMVRARSCALKALLHAGIPKELLSKVTWY